MSYIVYREEEKRTADRILVTRLPSLSVKIQVASCEFEEVGAYCIRPHKVETRYYRVLLANTARRVATKY